MRFPMPRQMTDYRDELEAPPERDENGRWAVEVSPGVVQTFGCGMAATAAATTENCATKALAKLKRLWASELGKACVGRNSRYCEVFVDLTPIPDNLLLPFLHQAVDKCASRSFDLTFVLGSCRLSTTARIGRMCSAEGRLILPRCSATPRGSPTSSTASSRGKLWPKCK